MPTSPPRFRVCPVCRRHGRLEYPGGCGPEACSQETAQWHLMTAVTQGRVPLEAVEGLYHDIEGSRLPVFEEQADAEFAEFVRTFNRKRKPDDASDFHDRAFN